MSDLVVQKFNIELWDECVDLYMKTYSKEPWNETWDSRDVVVNFFRNHYENNYFRGFSAIKDGQVVAVCLGFLKPWIKGMEYYIDDFFVGADYHRQGIGLKFMAGIKEQLLAANIHEIILNTQRGYPAQAFYENANFKVLEGLIVLAVDF